MHYKVHDLDSVLHIDIHAPGTNEKIDQFVIPKNTIEMFMLLSSVINDEIKKLFSIVDEKKEYVPSPSMDKLQIIVEAITEYKKIDQEFYRKRKNGN